MYNIIFNLLYKELSMAKNNRTCNFCMLIAIIFMLFLITANLLSVGKQIQDEEYASYHVEEYQDYLPFN